MLSHSDFDYSAAAAQMFPNAKVRSHLVFVCSQTFANDTKLAPKGLDYSSLSKA